MSYDIYLQIDTGNPNDLVTVVEVGNMTSNVAPMWAKALGGKSLGDLDGMNAGEAVALLEHAVSHIRTAENRHEYQAMNPPNGWGDHDGAALYLENLLRECRRHPKTTIYISR